MRLVVRRIILIEEQQGHSDWEEREASSSQVSQSKKVGEMSFELAKFDCRRAEKTYFCLFLQLKLENYLKNGVLVDKFVYPSFSKPSASLRSSGTDCRLTGVILDLQGYKLVIK